MEAQGAGAGAAVPGGNTGGIGGNTTRNPNRNNGQAPRRAGRNSNQQPRGSRAMNPNADMRGHVFDVISENYSKVDFRKSIEQLKGVMSQSQTSFATEILEGMRLLELDDPDFPVLAEGAGQQQFEEWKEDRKVVVRQREAYRNFRATSYAVVWNSCTQAMQTKLNAELDFEAARNNGIALLIIIRRLVYSFDRRKKKEECFLELLEELICLKRGSTTLSDFNDHFESITKVLEEEGWSITPSSLVEEIAEANGRVDAPNDEDRVEASQRILSILFVKNSKTQQPNSPAEGYHQHLRTNFIDGTDVYPTTVAQAFNSVQMHEANAAEVGQRTRRGDRRDRRDRRAPTANGVALATAALVPGVDGVTHENITCFNCHEVGHYAAQCPRAAQNGGQGNVAHVFVNVRCSVDPDWVLLDSQANADIFSNGRLIQNIRPAGSWLCIHGTGGV